MPSTNGQPDRFISSPKAYAATMPYADEHRDLRATGRPAAAASPAPIPTHADTSIWNGSHGPTPAVSRAEANSDVQPSTKPKPGPNTRPARISRKNDQLDAGRAGARARGASR